MAEANRDQNHVPVALGQSSASASVSLPFKIDSSTGRLLVDNASVAGANAALSNLAAVAINTSLISDTNNTDDLGSAAIKWANLFVTTIGATGTRVTKGWFTDLEVTNAIAGSVTGNAATVTTNANLTGIVTSVGNATAIADAALSIAKTSGLQAALDLKAPLASPTFTGVVTVPTPANPTDAVTKAYADAITQSLDIKNSVRVASTANIAVASALTNGSTIDGVVVATGDRVLLKDQSAGAENGIYVVVAAGAASRSTDANTSAMVTSGMYVFVSEGTVSADMGYVLTTNDPIVLGTTVLAFTQFSGAGQITAGNGLSKSGNTLTINTAVTVDKTTAQTLINKTLTAVKITDGSYIADSLGGILLAVDALPMASTVNYFTIYNAVTTSAPRFVATGSDTNISINLVPKGTGIVKGELKRFMVQLLDSATNQALATSIQGDFRISNRAITVKAVGAYVDTAGTTGLATIDINEAGVSIISTKITIDSTEKSSETAATPPVISDSAIAADAIITFDVDVIQTTPAKGLKVWIDYVYA